MLVWLAIIFTGRNLVMLGTRTMAAFNWGSSLRLAAKVAKDGQCAKTWTGGWSPEPDAFQGLFAILNHHPMG